VKNDHSLYGPLEDVAANAGHHDHPPRVGFFTDTSVCIGCKACEVACKEWNLVPEDGLDLLGMSFDNTGMLGANSWRHVAFIEQELPLGRQETGVSAGLPTGPSGTGQMSAVVSAGLRRAERGGGELGTTPLHVGAAAEDLGMPTFDLPGAATGAEGRTDFRWLMASDVCKHCTHAGCLDVCPTGALFRTEFGTVVVQQDICNGCGYCVSGCPYGVIDRRPHDGRAQKCTLCYDRLHDGLEPACAKACPTDSIQFGELDELRERAARRVEQLQETGVPEARLYGHDPNDGVGGNGAFFLLLDEPEAYGLPPDPVVPSRDLPAMWKYAGIAASAFLTAGIAAFTGRRR
jgi:formate dehydrogenase iron-sulfur subunit